MNERIRELAKQAEKYADKNFKGEPTWSEAYDSKFAELIIRECASICEARSDPLGYANLTSEANAKAIREHFGVKP